MCGIAGIFERGCRKVEPQLLMEMTRTLVHRGPDEEGYFVNANKMEGIEAGRLGSWKDGRIDAPIRTLNINAGNERIAQGNVGLGHRRLSIIDLSTGQQPLCNEDGSIWITFNGEIYNFQSLKSELEKAGYRFRTNSDTETIVHAYEQWGERSIERFRGMFAFALWDEKNQRLLIARDRVGKKPFYYAEDRGRFLFGSEIKAILQAPGVSREIDLAALSDYLSLLYVPSPRTIFSAIRKLPPAHYAVVTKDRFELHPYWDISFEPREDRSEAQIIEDLLGILDDSTRLRMISDVPLGAFLSGGVDSSAVVALMAHASREPVVTNSISFSVGSYDESPYARHVARQFSTNHHEFRVTPEAIPVIEKLAWHYDEPFADSSQVPTYYVSKTARENVTVSLSGDGGDENFAGYRRYAFDLRENFVRNLFPKALRGVIFGTLGRLYPKADFLPQIFRGKAFISNVARDPVEAYFFSVSAFHEEQKRRLLKPEIQNALKGYRTSELFHKFYRDAPAHDHLSRIQYLDIKTYLTEDILTKVDRASMAVSLEVRCPILDHVFMEYVARIPSKLKLGPNGGKHIFKKALKRHFDEGFLNRKKMGFAVPILEWLRGDLREYAKAFVLDGPATAIYLQREYLEKLWNQHQSGLRNWSTELWAVMMLNLWYQRFA
jgi:asparagine synthase (glutamine-hydrolysing)